MLCVGSLFSGIGGLDLGLERAGMRVVWQCEADEWCRRVLAKHWPDIPCYTDVRYITADAPPVDVLCGGFPCQPVSVAGKRLAQDDERWLWPEFFRVICALRPRIVIVENVAGLLARGIGDVLGDLAKAGYDAEWERLPAAAIGAPHRRERVWIMAYPCGSRLEGDGPAWTAWDCAAWPTEPNVRRVAHGIPHRVDRTRGLGNAVVPYVAEQIGRRVVEVFA